MEIRMMCKNAFNSCWKPLFQLEQFTTLGFIFLRSAGIYIGLIVLLRLFGKRELTQLSLLDLLLVLLISNAVQNAMTGPDTSFEGGLAAASGLLASNLILKQLAERVTFLRRILLGDPLMIIYRGKIQEKVMRQAGLSLQEIETACREHGIYSIHDVDLGILEPDGNFSFRAKDFEAHPKLK